MHFSPPIRAGSSRRVTINNRAHFLIVIDSWTTTDFRVFEQWTSQDHLTPSMAANGSRRISRRVEDFQHRLQRAREKPPILSLCRSFGVEGSVAVFSRFGLLAQTTYTLSKINDVKLRKTSGHLVSRFCNHSAFRIMTPGHD